MEYKGTCEESLVYFWKLISKNRVYAEIIGVDKKECTIFINMECNGKLK